MSRNISVSLGAHFETFIENEVSIGRFENAREVILAGLQLLEQEEAKVEALQKAIKEGIDSGAALHFDAQKNLSILKSTK